MKACTRPARKKRRKSGLHTGIVSASGAEDLLAHPCHGPGVWSEREYQRTHRAVPSREDSFQPADAENLANSLPSTRFSSCFHRHRPRICLNKINRNVLKSVELTTAFGTSCTEQALSAY